MVVLLDGRGLSNCKGDETAMRVSHWEQNLPRPTKRAAASHVVRMPPLPPSAAIDTECNEHQPIVKSNIVELSFYRKQQRVSLTGYSQKSAQYGEPIHSLKSAGQIRYFGGGKDYVERMKMNAAIFVFLIFLVAAGIWLMDGLAQAFGPLR